MTDDKFCDKNLCSKRILIYFKRRQSDMKINRDLNYFFIATSKNVCVTF